MELGNEGKGSAFARGYDVTFSNLLRGYPARPSEDKVGWSIVSVA